MRASEVASSFGTKESEVQNGETPSTVSRPSVSASGSRGTFSCRRWRLLSGKPSKDDDALDARVSAHKPSSRNVQRPTTSAVDSKNWATAATPFAAFLPRDTIVPITSRKSVAAAVLTSAFPPENVTKWDREMTICERKHVKAMGRMATRIYRAKSARGDPSDPSRRREKQVLKDQIYLPVLCQARIDGLGAPRASKSLHSSPRQEKNPQNAVSTFAIPDALAGMKLLSSQLDELRAGLEVTSERVNELSGRTERLWYPQPQHTRISNTAGRKMEQPEDSGSSSSSIETLILRVLERPASYSDAYQTDQEENTMESSDEIKPKSLDSRRTNNSEDDLLLLLSALDSTSQIPRDEVSKLSTSSNFIVTSED